MLRDRWSAERRRLDTVAKSLRLVWHASPRLAATGLLIALIESAMPPLMLLLLKRIIDVAAQGRAHAAMRPMMTLVVAVIAVAMIDASLRALAGYIAEAQSLAVSKSVYDLLLEQSAAIDLAYYENHRIHDALHRAQEDAPQRFPLLVSGMNQFVRAGATLVALAGVVLYFEPVVMIALFALTIPALIVRARLGQEVQRRIARITPLDRRASYFRSLLTGIESAKEIRLFDIGRTFLDRFRAARSELARERLSMARLRAMAETSSQFLPEVAIFSGLGFLAYRFMQGRLSFGGMVIFFWSLQWVRALLNETLSGFVGVYENGILLAPLFDFLALELRVREPESPRPLPQPIRSGITIERVTFRYPGATANALDDVTLSIRAGEKVALVGENGSGKTTLAKLLCRFYDPTEGEIRIDGAPLRSFATSALRRDISVVFQDYVCYDLTARENIRIGNIADADDARIESAAKRSGIDAAIARLPHGYDTQLGRRFEGGAELSIGEWQKIAVARAFTRDSRILILDEPTSALDAEAEYELFRRFYELAEGRTAILISHRLSTVKMAQTIFVLDRGRIVECGSHDELMARGGKYARLFNLQAEPYR